MLLEIALLAFSCASLRWSDHCESGIRNSGEEFVAECKHVVARSCCRVF
jgi:hypothetical protein